MKATSIRTFLVLAANGDIQKEFATYSAFFPSLLSDIFMALSDFLDGQVEKCSFVPTPYQMCLLNHNKSRRVVELIFLNRVCKVMEHLRSMMT